MQDIPFVGVQEEQAPLGCCSATRATNIMSFGQLTQKINLMPRFLCQVCPCFTLTQPPLAFSHGASGNAHRALTGSRAKVAGICTRVLTLTGKAPGKGDREAGRCQGQFEG